MSIFTRVFWKNSGFEWNDTYTKGNAYYNSGNDEKWICIMII